MRVRRGPQSLELRSGGSIPGEDFSAEQATLPPDFHSINVAIKETST